MEPGQQIIDGHTASRDLARYAGDVSGQAGARRIGKPEHRDRRFDGNAGDVDDTAPTAIHHGRQQRFDQGNRCEQVGIKGSNKVIPIPVGPHAGWWTTGIGDQDINALRFSEHGRLTRLRSDICRDSRYLDTINLANGGRCGLQRFTAPGVQYEVDTFSRQRLSTAAPQTL